MLLMDYIIKEEHIEKHYKYVYKTGAEKIDTSDAYEFYCQIMDIKVDLPLGGFLDFMHILYLFSYTYIICWGFLIHNF